LEAEPFEHGDSKSKRTQWDLHV